MTEGSQAYRALIASSKDKHKTIHDLVVKNGVLDIPKLEDSSIFQFVAKTIVGQQLSNKAATTIWRRIETLATELGTDIFGAFCDTYYDQVKACGVSKNKMKSIFSFKEETTTDPYFEITLRQSSYNDVLKRLTAIWGIGVWTADMVAIFYLKLPDVYPINDVAISNGIRKLCHEKVEAPKIASEFSPYQSHLCLHI